MGYQLLKFEKENCPPCKMVQMYLDDKQVEVERILAFDKVEKSAQYMIGTLPTLVLLENGEEVYRSTGFNADEIDEIVEIMGNGQ